MKLINVILTGGVGSRLWPLSRKSRPKQYIPIFDNKTLFQLCVERNSALCAHLIIVGNKDNQHLSASDLNKVKVKDYVDIVESTPRNTAAAIAFAAFAAAPEDILLVTPSDHIVTNAVSYKKAVDEAVAFADKDYLVTFGIPPTAPETGYGYIKYEGTDVLGFREKPNKETAQSYIETGNYLWNSGMFCFKAGVYLAELKKYEPLLFETAHAVWENNADHMLDLALSEKIPSRSIDYAVMERSSNIKVIPADFGWSDLGSFDSLWGYIEKNKPESVSNNLVLGTDKHVEFLGVDNLVLVETDDAILVLPRDKSQEVKSLYEKLEKDRPELLQ